MQKSTIEETLEKMNKGKSIVLPSHTASLSKCMYIYCVLRFLVDGRIKIFNALAHGDEPKITNHKILSIMAMNADEQISYKLEKTGNKKIIKIKSALNSSMPSLVELDEARHFIKKLKYKIDKYNEQALSLERFGPKRYQGKNQLLDIDIEFLLDFLDTMRLNKLSNNLTSILDAARLDFTLLSDEKVQINHSFYLNLVPSPDSIIMNLTSPMYFTYEYSLKEMASDSLVEQINNLSGSYKLAQKIKALNSIGHLTSIIPSALVGQTEPLTPTLEIAGRTLLNAVSHGLYSLGKNIEHISSQNPFLYKEDSYDKYSNVMFEFLNTKGLNPNGFIFLSDKGLPMAYSKEGRKEISHYTIEKMKYKSPGVFNLANSNTIGKIYRNEEDKKLFFTLSFQLKFSPHKFSQFMIDDIIETAHEMRVLQAKGKNPLGNSKNLKYNILTSKNNIKIK